MTSLNLPKPNEQLTYADLAEVWTGKHRDTFCFLVDEPNYDLHLDKDDGRAARWYRFLSPPKGKDGSRSIAEVHACRIEASILDMLLCLRDQGEMLPIDRHAVEEIRFLSSRLLMSEGRR